MAIEKEWLQPRHLRLGQPQKVAYQSGFIAEPERRQKHEIHGSAAYYL